MVKKDLKEAIIESYTVLMSRLENGDQVKYQTLLDTCKAIESDKELTTAEQEYLLQRLLDNVL